MDFFNWTFYSGKIFKYYYQNYYQNTNKNVYLLKENEKLTAKMSLRRNNILKTYTPLIDEMYQNKEGFTISYETK